MPLERLDIELPEGIWLDCIRSGDGQGPAIVLIHGYSDSNRAYLPLIESLPATLNIVALSMRGHGDSSKPTAGYAVAQMARDVASAMDVLGIPRAIVVGHSMGSVIAQRLAVAAPSRVAALVLIGAFADIGRRVDAMGLVAEVHSATEAGVDPSFVREFQKSSLAGPVCDEFFEAILAESMKLPAFAWRQLAEGFASDCPPIAAGAIAAPTMLLWGDAETMADWPEQQALLERIPGSRVEVFQGVGHNPHWEQPARSAALITEFADYHAAVAA